MPNLVFVDAVAFIGLLATDDQYHVLATRNFAALRRQRCHFVTNSAVITEVLDGAAERDRRVSQRLHEAIVAFEIEVAHVDENLFQRAWTLYDSRSDKAWSLTDCISFCLMQERGVSRALTYDHHFQQAGFLALMRDES